VEAADPRGSQTIWAEHDGPFNDLLSRDKVRSMTAETDRMGQAAIDIYEFKQINDNYSHAIGDEVLRRIAVILSAHCRAYDVPVREGGDEFVVLVVAGGGAAEEVA